MKARNKFKEWKDTAEKNGIENFTKDFDVNLEDMSICSILNGCLLDTSAKIKFTFIVTFGDAEAVLFSSFKSAADLQGSITKGAYISFNSVDDIDNFIQSLKTPKAAEIVKKIGGSEKERANGETKD